MICLAVRLGDMPVTAKTPASERVDIAKECNSCLFDPKPYSSKLKPFLHKHAAARGVSTYG